MNFNPTKIMHVAIFLFALLLAACGGSSNNDTNSSNATIPTIPTITNFTPASGAVGSTVIINGTNFSPTAANNTVNFNGVSTAVSSATDTQLTVTVPATATSGTITVTTGGQTATSATSFTVSIANIVALAPNVSTTGTVSSSVLNQYSVAATPGTQYVASLTGIVGDADLRVYTDNTFSTLATCAASNNALLGSAPEDCIVTATNSILYLATLGVGSVSNSYSIRVSPKNNATALSEGTAANPVTLSPNVIYQGSIDPSYSAYSYYKVSTAAGATIGINLTGLQGAQSLDFRVYNSSTGANQSCTNTGLNGLLPEECVLPGGIPYDITVINYAAGVGGPYTLMVDSPNDPASGVTFGTTSTLAMDVSNWTTVNAGVLDKYSVPVTSGTAYVASLYGITGDVDLRVYTDSTYTTLASCAAANVNAVKTGLEDCIVTPTGNTLYLGAYGFGVGANSYRIRVTPQSTGALVNQGTSVSPIILTPGSSYAGTIAPAYSSYSYYRVTTTGTANTSINLTGMSGAENIDVRVYAVPSGTYQTCNTSRAGVLPEECILPSGTWDITVINYGAGIGGNYLITAD